MLLPVTFIPIMKYMVPDGLLLTQCVLGKAALLPLLYKIHHLLSYFGLTAHGILFSLQIYRSLYSMAIGTWTVGYIIKALPKFNGIYSFNHNFSVLCIL